MKKLLLTVTILVLILMVTKAHAVDMWFDVDTAISEAPVNIMSLTDDTDMTTRETSVAYNASGMDLRWNFVTTGGSYTSTAVTPTTGGDYDWNSQGDGMYSIEIPASGGASINNDTEGYGWFTGLVTGVLHWRGPIIGFRAAATNNSLVDTATITVSASNTVDANVTQVAGDAVTDNGDGRLEVNIEEWSDTAVNADTAGYPSVTIKDGSGTGELDTDSGTVLLRSATETQIDAIETDTGTTLDNYVDDLETRLTATRAGYLDELGAANLPSDIDDILADTADIQGNQDWNVWDDAARTLTANTNLNDPTASDIVDEWETQSQADPTGFHVNVLEVGGTSQTANDNGADINAILTDTADIQGNQNWDVWDDAARTLTANTNLNDPTAASIADAVWDEVIVGAHDGADAAGALLDSPGDWATATGFMPDTEDGSSFTAVPWNAAWDAEVESEVDDSIGGGTGTALSAIPWNANWDAEVESEANDALVDEHLDHLLAADYDPASKPGVATALLNELVESDSGVSRFTENALEQAPSGGGGGDATEANQTTIIGHLTDIKGGGWSDENLTTIDSNVDSVLTDTGTTLNNYVDDLETRLTAARAGYLDTINDLADNERLDLILDELTSQGDTNETKLDTIDGNVDDILTDTNELQTDDIPGTLTTIESKIDTIDGIVDDIVDDTNELQTDDIPGTLTTMDGKIDTIDSNVDILLVAPF